MQLFEIMFYLFVVLYFLCIVRRIKRIVSVTAWFDHASIRHNKCLKYYTFVYNGITYEALLKEADKNIPLYGERFTLKVIPPIFKKGYWKVYSDMASTSYGAYFIVIHIVIISICCSILIWRLLCVMM